MGSEKPETFEEPKTKAYAFVTVTLSPRFCVSSATPTILMTELKDKNITTLTVGVTREATIKSLIAAICSACNVDLGFLPWHVELEAEGGRTTVSRYDKLFRTTP